MPLSRLISRLAFCAFILLSAPAFAAGSQEEGLKTIAPYAFMMDFNTGTVLLAKNADEPIGPSSMSKLMTAYMVFDALKHGIIKLDDTFRVSEKAWRMGGSKMFVKVGTDVRIEDLIQGVVVQSGNDACIALAEGLSGSEEAFAEEMNKMAAKLGMVHSTLMNATGWPHEDHKMSVRDLGILAKHLIQEFPDYYHYFAETEFTYNGIHQPNRNRLLHRGIGVDGLKTGHTEGAGYGIVNSAKQGDRRLILVLNGLKSEKEREAEAVRLLTYGFRDFENVKIFSVGDKIEEAEVWFGKKRRVPLVLKENIEYTVSKRARDAQDIKARVEYESPISAPVEAGKKIASLIVSYGTEERRYPLYADENIAERGFFGKLMAKLYYFVLG